MTALAQDIDRACACIAPTWPLDQFIAVNPYWGWVDKPMPQAAAALEALGGTRLTMPRNFSSRRINPASMVLPRPTSSANR